MTAGARKPKPFVPLETPIVLGCLEYLRWSPVLAWRNNSGGMKDKAGQFVRFGVPGSADIFGIVRRGQHLGRFVAVEVKRPGKDLEPHQQVWHALVAEAGAISLVVHSIAELQALLEAELAKPRP